MQMLRKQKNGKKTPVIPSATNPLNGGHTTPVFSKAFSGTNSSQLLLVTSAYLRSVFTNFIRRLANETTLMHAT
jgi:hypothetical protein